MTFSPLILTELGKGYGQCVGGTRIQYETTEKPCARDASGIK